MIVDLFVDVILQKVDGEQFEPDFVKLVQESVVELVGCVSACLLVESDLMLKNELLVYFLVVAKQMCIYNIKI